MNEPRLSFGRAHTALIPKSFRERIIAFYAKYAPETLDDTDKMDNLMSKYSKNADQTQKDNFESKTFSALHNKYDTKVTTGLSLSPSLSLSLSLSLMLYQGDGERHFSGHGWYRCYGFHSG